MTARSAAADFTTRTCTAPPGRADRMRDIVVAEAPRGRPIRLLDLGCGTGSLLFRLVDALPDAALVGIDVSPANIDAAARAMAPGAAARVRLHVADFVGYDADPFDVIVSDGVLHLIPGGSEALAAKLARDLKPGGVLVCDMPYACAYNTAFAIVRRALRAVRGPWLDRAILQIGRVLHGRDMDDRGLRERVAYMYLPPERVMDAALERTFAAAGLRRRSTHAMPSTSLSQLRHSVAVFERVAPAR